MAVRLLYALPLALLFMTMSDQWTLGGLLVGYAAGVGILLIVGGELPSRVKWGRLPLQFVWLVIYIVRLAWEIMLSSFDVARRVLDPNLPINTGEVVVPLHDDENRIAIAALSAHAITVTPGEMTVDFKTIDGETYMVVHTLDVDATSKNGEREQIKRSTLLQRIMGDDD